MATKLEPRLGHFILFWVFFFFKAFLSSAHERKENGDTENLMTFSRSLTLSTVKMPVAWVVQRSMAVEHPGGVDLCSARWELSILKEVTTLSGSFLICKTEEDLPC